MKKFDEIIRGNVLFDSHAHMSEYATSIGEVMERAKREGVQYVFDMATGMNDIETVLANSDEKTGLLPAIGIHPERVIPGSDIFLPAYFEQDGLIDDDLKQLESLIAKNVKELIMVGEIGLDYFVGRRGSLSNESTEKSKTLQKKLFERQLELATEYKLPVSIHIREAFKDAFEILNEFKNLTNVVLHCFTGTYDDLKIAIDRSYYLGVNGILTYSKASDLRDVFRKYIGRMGDNGKTDPIDFYNKNILFETDSPLLRPANAMSEGRLNEPMNIIKIYEQFKKICS